MQAVPFLKQLLFAFRALGVSYASIYRANLGTPGFAMVPDAFGAFIRIDYITALSFRNCLIFALSLTGSATYAVIGDFVRHLPIS